MSCVEEQTLEEKGDNPEDLSESKVKDEKEGPKPPSSSPNTISNESLSEEKPDDCGAKSRDSEQNADLSEDFDVTSTHKTSATKAVQTPTNTAYVAQHVPFWRDQKFWIQIAIMGIMQLVIGIYMDADLKYCRNSDKENSCADSARDVFKIADKKEFVDLLDEDWKTRKETIADDLNKYATQFTKTMENVKSEMKGELTSLDRKWVERVETFKGDFDGKIEEIKEKMRLFEKKFEGVDGQLNLFYSEIGGISNYIVVFFLAMVIGGIICINKFLIPRQRPLERTPHSFGQGQKSIDTITERLERKGLRNGTLIISFHPSTQQLHWNVLDAVSAYFKSTPLKIVIQSSDDIMNVQPQKLVIIFVDFNDRNIILENEESEIGDLRNQTTKVFMSLGCDVFVIYCKDLGSRDLKQNSLYNARLNCIDRHPVLSELKIKNRVLSINDKFHPHQLEYLRNCFQQL